MLKEAKPSHSSLRVTLDGEIAGGVSKIDMVALNLEMGKTMTIRVESEDADEAVQSLKVPGSSLNNDE